MFTVLENWHPLPTRPGESVGMAKALRLSYLAKSKQLAMRAISAGVSPPCLNTRSFANTNLLLGSGRPWQMRSAMTRLLNKPSVVGTSGYSQMCVFPSSSTSKSIVRCQRFHVERTMCVTIYAWGSESEMSARLKK